MWLEAASLRQRQRRQEQIARENRRIDERIKDILEANLHRGGHGYTRRRGRGGHRVPGARSRNCNPSVPSKCGQQHIGQMPRDEPRESCNHRQRRRDACCHGNQDSRISERCNDNAGQDIGNESKYRAKLGGNGKVHNGVRDHQHEEDTHPRTRRRDAEHKRNAGDGWRELYKKREALALAVEVAAENTARARLRIETLRAKTMWIEANARRCRLSALACFAYDATNVRTLSRAAP